MYIVFLAPETKDAKENKQFRAICEEIKSNKHTVYDGTFPMDSVKHEEHASRLTKEIKKADAIVVEVTYSNFNLGRLITLAVQQHKPVLMLQQEHQTIPLVIGSSRLIAVKPYKTIKEIGTLLQDFFKVAKKQRLTYRFNLMLNRDINLHLMEKAREYGISKADYIRDLIGQDMGGE